MKNKLITTAYAILLCTVIAILFMIGYTAVTALMG